MTKEEVITYLEDAKSNLPYKFEQAIAHTKDHDGFREHWSEPIEWCSRGERREP